MLRFSVRASAEGAYSRVLAAWLDMVKPSAAVKLFGGGQGVGSLDDVVATKDGDSGEVGLELPVFRGDLYDDREGFLIVKAPNSQALFCLFFFFFFFSV